MNFLNFLMPAGFKMGLVFMKSDQAAMYILQKYSYLNCSVTKYLNLDLDKSRPSLLCEYKVK